VISTLRRRVATLEVGQGDGCPACGQPNPRLIIRTVLVVSEDEPAPPSPPCERCGQPVPRLIIRKVVVGPDKGGET